MREPTEIGNMGDMRESARNILCRVIEKTHRHAEAFELIEKYIDWQKLKPDEEGKLWAFFVKFPIL